MKTRTVEERVLAAHVRDEILTYLGPVPKQQNLALAVGKLLIWTAGSLDDEQQTLQLLGEKYRSLGIMQFERDNEPRRHSAKIKAALQAAIAEITELEGRGL